MLRTSLLFIAITAIFLCPVIPIAVKGMTGVIFIIIIAAETSMKAGLITALFLIGLHIINHLPNNNIDFQIQPENIVVGSLMYCFVAVYFGLCADRLKNKNRELQMEIEMRKSIEKNLKENLALLESLMSTLPTPVCFKDLKFRYTGCNSAYEDYFGFSEKEIIGKTAHELFSADVADVCLQMDVDLLDKKIKQVRESGFLSKDGGWKYFIFTKALLSDDQGNPTGIVGVFLDTTEQKEHEKLKRSMEKEMLTIAEMQKYDRLKTEFFSNISHELRTPLNVIFCAVQLMEMNLNDDESSISQSHIKKNVLSIRQNCLRLLRLVNNLIDITKIDAHAFEVKKRNQDIVSFVREITLSVADYVTNKGLKLIFHSDVKEKIMAFDEEKIERIMLNLLSNAIKFSPLGESIHVDLVDNVNQICIRVRDSGIGIPPDCLQDIFERFYQISPVNTRLREGSGIGLSLVRSLVEMHQGTISVESECGNGATFTVVLPSVLIPENIREKERCRDRRIRIENIQLEFSDIYLVNKQERDNPEQMRFAIGSGS